MMNNSAWVNGIPVAVLDTSVTAWKRVQNCTVIAPDDGVKRSSEEMKEYLSRPITKHVQPVDDYYDYDCDIEDNFF